MATSSNASNLFSSSSSSATGLRSSAIGDTFLGRRAARKAAINRMKSEPPGSAAKTLGSRHPSASVGTVIGGRLNPSRFTMTQTSQGERLVFKGFTTSSAPVSPASRAAGATAPDRARGLAISDLALRTPTLVDMPEDLHSFRGQTGFLAKPMEGMRATRILCCSDDDRWLVWLQSIAGDRGRWQTTGLPVEEKDDPRRICPELHETLVRACDGGAPLSEASALAGKILPAVLKAGGTIPFSEANKRLLELEDVLFVPLAVHNATDPAQEYRPLLKAVKPALLLIDGCVPPAGPRVWREERHRRVATGGDNQRPQVEERRQRRQRRQQQRDAEKTSRFSVHVRGRQLDHREGRGHERGHSHGGGRGKLRENLLLPKQPHQSRPISLNPLSPAFHPPSTDNTSTSLHYPEIPQNHPIQSLLPVDEPRQQSAGRQTPILERREHQDSENTGSKHSEESHQSSHIIFQTASSQQQKMDDTSPRGSTVSRYGRIQSQGSSQYFEQQQQFGYGQPYQHYREFAIQNQPPHNTGHTHRESQEYLNFGQQAQRHRSHGFSRSQSQNFPSAAYNGQQGRVPEAQRPPSSVYGPVPRTPIHPPPRGLSPFLYPQAAHTSADSSYDVPMQIPPYVSHPHFVSQMGQTSPSESLTAAYRRNQAIEYERERHQSSEIYGQANAYSTQNYMGLTTRIPFTAPSPRSERYRSYSTLPSQSSGPFYSTQPLHQGPAHSFYRLSHENPHFSRSSSMTTLGQITAPQAPGVPLTMAREVSQTKQPRDTNDIEQSDDGRQSEEVKGFSRNPDVIASELESEPVLTGLQQSRAPTPEGRRRSDQHNKLFGPKGVLSRSETHTSVVSSSAETKISPLHKVGAIAGKLVEKGLRRQPGDVVDVIRRVSDKINRSMSPSKDLAGTQRRSRDQPRSSRNVDAEESTQESEEDRGPHISMPPGEQMWVLAQIEFILTMAANNFLIEQKEAGRMTPESVQRVVGEWLRRNRPQPVDFMFPLATQYDLIQHNMDRFVFHGPLPPSSVTKATFLNAWRNLIRDLALRTFCLPDHALKKIIVDGFRVLEMLGAQSDAFIEFRDMQRKLTDLVEKGARERATRGRESTEHGVTRRVTTPLLISSRGIIDDDDKYYDDGIYKGPDVEKQDSPSKKL